MAKQITRSRISAFRLHRHHLAKRDDTDPVAVCGDICGAQAQVQSAAEISLGIRSREFTAADITSALWEKRDLVKTSCMRQTLHLIPAADFPLYINALKESRTKALLNIMGRFDLGKNEYEELNRLVADSVGSEPVVRKEITEKITGSVGKKLKAYVEKAWEIQLYRPALVEGVICYGPREGNRVTYVRADRWLPPFREVNPESAKRELLKRYLKAYGPASQEDFSKWSGMPKSEVDEIWESVRDSLSEVAIGEQVLFILKDDLDRLSESRLTNRVINLLPGFDTYLLGYADTDHLVSTEHYKKVYRDQGWITPVVLLNGRAIGVWSFDRSRKTITVDPFESLSAELKTGIEKEANKLEAFLETSFSLDFS